MESSPVFVGGAGRSGTTLLRALLDAHPNLCAGPEIKILPEIARLYQTMNSAMIQPVLAFYNVTSTKLNGAFASFVMSFFEEFIANSRANRLVEKTPHNVLVMKELAQIFPDAKFIHVVRDGRDVACSLTGMDWLDANGEAVWYVKNIQNATEYWKQVVEQGIRDAGHALLQDRVQMIRYEDLILAPETTMRDLLEFLGETWSEQVLNYHQVDRSAEPPESSSSQVANGIYTQAKNRWENEFTAYDKAIFKDIAGDLLVRLGYEQDFSW